MFLYLHKETDNIERFDYLYIIQSYENTQNHTSSLGRAY